MEGPASDGFMHRCRESPESAVRRPVVSYRTELGVSRWLLRSSVGLYLCSMLLPSIGRADDPVMWGWQAFVFSFPMLFDGEIALAACFANPAYIVAILFHLRARRTSGRRTMSYALAVLVGFVAVLTGLSWPWHLFAHGDEEMLLVGYVVWQVSLWLGCAAAVIHPGSQESDPRAPAS